MPSRTPPARSWAVSGGEIETRRGENTVALERSEEKLQSLARTREDLDTLVRAIAQAGQGVDELTGRYGDTSPTVLLQPAEESAEPLHPEVL